MKLKMNSFKKVVLLALPSAALLISFQNCAGGHFDSVAAPSNSEFELGSSIGGTAQPKLSVVLSWDKSTAENIKGYRIYLGSRSGVSEKVIDAGKTSNPELPEYELTNLNPNSVYYAVVKAYDKSGLESIASNEIEITGN